MVNELKVVNPFMARAPGGLNTVKLNIFPNVNSAKIFFFLYKCFNLIMPYKCTACINLD